MRHAEKFLTAVLWATGVFCVAAAAAAEIKMTPAMQIAVTSGIQDSGYNCPLAKIAWAKGPDAYGDVVKVFCGPRDRHGTYEHAVFRMTFLRDGTISVIPWRD